jgi:hypothetical protein
MTHRRMPMGTTPQTQKKDADGVRPWTKAYWKLMKERCPGYEPNTDDALQDHMTPEMLKNLAILYFEEAHNDAIIKRDYIRSGEKAGVIVEIPVQRPFSHCGLEMFIEANGIKPRISDYRKNRDGKYQEFAEVTAWIDAVIAQDKYDGAAVGNYNSMLVIRDLGLAEKVDASVKAEQPLFSDLPQAPAPSADDDLLG